MFIGSHVSMKAPNYLLGSVKEALSYGANTFMVYTGAPQNTKRKAIDELKIDEALALMDEVGMQVDRMIIHAPYLINLANFDKQEISAFAKEFLETEIKRTAAFHAKYLVLHPGSHTTATKEEGMQRVIELLNDITIEDDVVICLETMAGKGSEVGSSFEEIAYILNHLVQKDHYGVCLDTCHIHDAGYDLSDFDAILDQFDEIIGLDRLHVIHLNDSKNVQGAHKDRHANIGQGEIGFEALYNVAHNKRVSHVSKILETPYIDKLPPYKEEIERLRKE